jgi:hypothetical protein
LPIGASTFCSRKTALSAYLTAKPSTAGPAAWQTGHVKRMKHSKSTRRVGADDCALATLANTAPAKASAALQEPEIGVARIASPRALI